jgi:hypothetical protein
MTEPKGNGHAGPAPTEPSRIVITFTGAAGADMAVEAPGVSLSQLMGAAFYLDVLAREARAGAVTRQAMAGLVPASAITPDALRKLGLA